jgi:hypothetical protein
VEWIHLAQDSVQWREVCQKGTCSVELERLLKNPRGDSEERRNQKIQEKQTDTRSRNSLTYGRSRWLALMITWSTYVLTSWIVSTFCSVRHTPTSLSLSLFGIRSSGYMICDLGCSTTSVVSNLWIAKFKQIITAFCILTSDCSVQPDAPMPAWSAHLLQWPALFEVFLSPYRHLFHMPQHHNYSTGFRSAVFFQMRVTPLTRVQVVHSNPANPYQLTTRDRLPIFDAV